MLPPESIIAVVGGINMDMIFTVDRVLGAGESKNARSFARCPGGKGANTAVAAYRASQIALKNGISSGIKVFINGAVGDDEFGLQLKQQLEESGVITSTVQVLKGETSGLCCVLAEGDESRNVAYQGANFKWKPPVLGSVTCFGGNKKPDLLVLHLGIPADVIEGVLTTAALLATDTLLNPSPATPLNKSTYGNVTHLILNESEARILATESVEPKTSGGNIDWLELSLHFIRLGAQNVVITLGAKGAVYATHEHEIGHVSAEKVTVVDATGAGDAFVGTYAVEYVRSKGRQWNIRDAVERASKAAAKAVQHVGAQ
ncbi:hypothetical protein TWF281_007834 [Arthrobotrys megalospora]